MTKGWLACLRCPGCGGRLEVEVFQASGERVQEGHLRCACTRSFPVIDGVARLLPDDLQGALVRDHEEFFGRHPALRPTSSKGGPSATLKTLRAFGDEWRRFPEVEAFHRRIFDWYFEGPQPVTWRNLRVLDAGCGMGRWLHFARGAGAEIAGMDLSPAIDVAAARETRAAFVQADLRQPPFAPASFDLVYCLGVLHHLEDPEPGFRALAGLVKPGGELRVYVYRSLEAESVPRRALLRLVSGLRALTTRLPYSAVHAIALGVATMATGLFVWPRRGLRRFAWGDRVSGRLPLVQYADVPFRMLVSEQFDRLVAPLEHRYRPEEVKSWFEGAGLELVALLPGLGWRAVGRRPFLAQGDGSSAGRPIARA